MRAYHVQGNPVINRRVKDFVWVNKKQLKEYIDPDVLKKVKMVMDH
jgi:hypothetical protein